MLMQHRTQQERVQGEYVPSQAAVWPTSLLQPLQLLLPLLKRYPQNWVLIQIIRAQLLTLALKFYRAPANLTRKQKLLRTVNQLMARIVIKTLLKVL